MTYIYECTTIIPNIIMYVCVCVRACVRACVRVHLHLIIHNLAFPRFPLSLPVPLHTRACQSLPPTRVCQPTSEDIKHHFIFAPYSYEFLLYCNEKEAFKKKNLLYVWTKHLEFMSKILSAQVTLNVHNPIMETPAHLSGGSHCAGI